MILLLHWLVIGLAYAGPTINGHPVEEEPGISSGIYIAPNEMDFDVYWGNPNSCASWPFPAPASMSGMRGNYRDRV